MATLFFENGQSTSNIEDISNALSPLGVQLSHWPIEPSIQSILQKESLDEKEKQRVLEGCDGYFQQLKDTLGYQSCDLIVLHEKIDGLDTILAKFDKTHTHDDDEVRYIVDGEGVFGFTRPDGSQVELQVVGGDYINVPQNTEHWFYLTSGKRIKAVRYFTTMVGWVPVYTNKEIRLQRQT